MTAPAVTNISEEARISSLVVKVAERCNLNCSYCYMYNHADQSYLRRPAFMSDEVFAQLLFEYGFDDLHKGLPLLHRVVHEGMPMCAMCDACRERGTCSGGYLPHRYSSINGFDNPSIWCQDLLTLFAHVRNYIDTKAGA